MNKFTPVNHDGLPLVLKVLKELKKAARMINATKKKRKGVVHGKDKLG